MRGEDKGCEASITSLTSHRVYREVEALALLTLEVIRILR